MFRKEKIEKLVFSLKSVIKQFSQNLIGIISIFLLFKKNYFRIFLGIPEVIYCIMIIFFCSNFNRGIQAGLKIFQTTFQINFSTIITIIFKCRMFFLDQCPYYLIEPRWVFVSKYERLVLNEVAKNIKNSAVENVDFFINIGFKKALFQSN